MSARRKYPTDLQQVRTAVADYIGSEGCSCCQDRDAHKERQAAVKSNPQCPDCGATLQVEPDGKLKHIKHAS